VTSKRVFTAETQRSQRTAKIGEQQTMEAVFVVVTHFFLCVLCASAVR